MRSLFRWASRMLLLIVLIAAVAIGFLLPDEMIDEWRTRLGFDSASDGPTPADDVAPPPQEIAQQPAPSPAATPAAATSEPATPVPPYWARGDAPEPRSPDELSYDESRFRPATIGEPEAADRGPSAPDRAGREVEDWTSPGAAAAPEKYSFRPLDGSAPLASSQGPSASGTGPQNDRDKLLSAARRAYWKGELDRSIGYYRQLTQDYPEEPDFFGELGNVFREQGEMELAAKAYYDAAVLLVNRGDRERAGSLAEAISRLSDEYAESLQQLLQDQQSLSGPSAAQ